MREDADIVMRWCELDANAYRLHCDIEKYKTFISDLVEIWLIKYDKKDDVYYSCRLQSDVEYMRDKSVKASRSATIRRSKRDANALQTDSESNAKYINKHKEEEIKEDKKRLKKDFIPPSLDDVKQYFQEKWYTEYGAKKAFDYYDVAWWKDSNGKQIKNRKQKMISVWFKPEYEIKKTDQKTKTKSLPQDIYSLYQS